MQRTQNDQNNFEKQSQRTHTTWILDLLWNYSNYWYKYRYVNQDSRIESRNGQLIFNKNAKVIQWEKSSLFHKLQKKVI